MSGGCGVHLHTLGCPKNEADSDALAASLRARGVRVCDEPGEASHILLNTCGFIEEAREESIGAILSIADAYPGAELLAMGCLVERYREELEDGLPEVSGWYGLGETPALLDRLEREAATPSDFAARVDSGPGLGHSRSYAYIKVSDGCDHRCTFCAIPMIKGPYRAVVPAEIIASAGRALEAGARELVLVGQDTAIWSGDGMDLTGLIDRLAADERVSRVRLMYLQPEHVSEGLLGFMAGHEKLCRYLDIPFQHASRSVLRRMGRSGDGDSYLALLGRARKLMPDVSVRSTFIVGFPGESDEDVETLLAFIAGAGLEHAGVFAYSPEEGTRAFGLSPAVPEDVIRSRLTAVTRALADAAEEAVAARVGESAEVIVDECHEGAGPEGTFAVGRTRGQAPEVDGITFLEGERPSALRVGDLIRVVVTESIGYDLVAEPIPSENGAR